MDTPEIFERALIWAMQAQHAGFPGFAAALREFASTCTAGLPIHANDNHPPRCEQGALKSNSRAG